MSVIVVTKKNGHVVELPLGDIHLEHPRAVKLEFGPEHVLRFEKVGNDLVLVLLDGQKITITNFFVIEDGERSELLLQDADEVLWWGQYTSPWAEFHFAEIEIHHGLAAPWTSTMPWLLPLLAVAGVGLAVSGGSDSTPVNNIPTAEPQSLTTPPNTPVDGRIQAQDPDGDTLGYTIASQPANGTVTIDPETGEYRYTPIPAITVQTASPSRSATAREASPL